MALSWKERKEKLKNKVKDSAENREGKASTTLSFKSLGDQDVKWVDKVKHGRDENKFDILPFIVTQEWYQNMRKFTGAPTGLEPGDVDYKLEFAVHNNVGPEQQKIICLLETFGEPCPICEERARLLDNPDEDPEGKLAEGLKPKWRCLYNVIDLNADDEIRLWEISYHLFEKLLLTEVYMGDEELKFFWDIEDGKTINWRGKEKKFGTNKFVEADRIDFDDRDPYEDSIVEETYPLDQLLVIPSYEKALSVLTGGLGEKDTSSKKEEKEDTGSKRRSRFKKEEPEQEEETPFNDDCPQGLTFGVDFNQDDKCQKCDDDSYDACESKFNDDGEQEEPEPEPEQEEESIQRRQRKKSSNKEEETKTTGRRRRR